MSLPSPFPCDRCGWMRWDCVCDGRTAAQRLRGDEMSSRQQERAGEPDERLERHSEPVREWPVLPPTRKERTELTVGEAIALARQAGEDAA